MKQYKNLLKTIRDKGTWKNPARKGMPRTLSLFGHQFRHDLHESFPLLTTKKTSLKNIAVELLWILRGDSNIEYMLDNGCKIWLEDSYQFYVNTMESQGLYPMTFKDYEHALNTKKTLLGLKSVHGGIPRNYSLGDTGKQYPWLWRRWSDRSNKVDNIWIDTDFLPAEENIDLEEFRKLTKSTGILPFDSTPKEKVIDQFRDLIKGLKENPEGRRHIITAWNPETLDDMALNACHAMVQFNCRPLEYYQRSVLYAIKRNQEDGRTVGAISTEIFDDANIPKYYLDCQLFQRSCDFFLGLGYNIASYSLLTHILCKMLNMVPGEYIHSFGDVHIYENHLEQTDELLERDERELPELEFSEWFENSVKEKHFEQDLDEWIQSLKPEDFKVKNYNPHPTIKGELSTGIKK